MTANATQTLTRPTRPRGTAPRPERPAVIVGTRLPRDSSAGDVVLAYLRIYAHALRTLEPAVRADESDSVHQMRVATRRLRATRPPGTWASAQLAGENAFTYGLLYECELHRAQRRQADARGVWKRASRPRYRRWMN